MTWKSPKVLQGREEATKKLLSDVSGLVGLHVIQGRAHGIAMLHDPLRKVAHARHAIHLSTDTETFR
jgi:hypothetical protein